MPEVITSEYRTNRDRPAAMIECGGAAVCVTGGQFSTGTEEPGDWHTLADYDDLILCLEKARDLLNEGWYAAAAT